MATRILLRKDHSDNWTSNNPILLAGEIGIETNTLKFKIGNGSRWNDISTYAFNAGLPNGVALLDADGLVPLSDLPSDVALSADVISMISDAIADITTTDVTEGTNLYFTDQRAQDATAVTIQAAIDTAAADATSKAALAESNAINTAATSASQAVTSAIIALTTTDIAEGDNLYFTDERVASAITSNLTTSNVPEGSRLYFTNQRAVAANNVAVQNAVNTALLSIEDLRTEIAATYVTDTSLGNTLDANGYVIDADRNQPQGFAGLDSSSKILDSVVPDTIARKVNTVFTGDTEVENLEISGNLTFSGTATQINSQDLSVTDSVIYLANSQYTSDILDIGIYGAYGTSSNSEGSHPHTGLIRDSSDKKWKLFSDGPEVINNSIDFTSVTYDALKIGGLESETATIGNVTNSEIQYLSGLTGVIQTQIDSVSQDVTDFYNSLTDSLNLKSNVDSPAFTGVVDFSGASVSGLDLLPAQTSNSGKFLQTDGTTISWEDVDFSSYLTSSLAASTYLSITTATNTYQKKVMYGTDITPPSGTAGDVYIQY